MLCQNLFLLPYLLDYNTQGMPRLKILIGSVSLNINMTGQYQQECSHITFSKASKYNSAFCPTPIPIYSTAIIVQCNLTLRRLMSCIYGAPILDVSRSHTTTQHSRQDSSGRMISSSQRPLPDNTRHSQQTNIHAPGIQLVD